MALKRSNGVATDAQVLEGAASILKGLDGFSTEELGTDADQTQAALETLGGLIDSAQKSSTSLQRLGRDGSGRKIDKRHDQKRVEAATKSRGVGLDQFGRKPDGTRPSSGTRLKRLV